jgi:hypothetical protein
MIGARDAALAIGRAIIAARLRLVAGRGGIGARRAAVANSDAVIAADIGGSANRYRVDPVPNTEEPEESAVLATVLLEPTTWILSPQPAVFPPLMVLLSPKAKELLP